MRQQLSTMKRYSKTSKSLSIMAGQGNPRTKRVAELQGEEPNGDFQFRSLPAEL